MASGCARACASKTSWARQPGSRRAGPTPGTPVYALISHLPRGVAAPSRPRRHRFALHKEGVRGEHRALSHRHAVMHEGTDADRAAGPDRRPAGLVGAVLLRVALDDALLIEHALVPDDGQARLGDENAVVVHPLADAHANQPPQHALE